MEKCEQYIHVFNHFDSNKDRKISPVELQHCVNTVGGNMTVEEAEKAVLLMDSDNDGLLCLEDFVRIVEGSSEDEKVNDLKEAFKMYEMAGSGCITPKSLKKMLNRLGERKSVHECKSMIARFDINGDGVLNFDEFKVMMTC